jgi:soluble lytic murein transglycosylase-like protein
MIPERFLRVRPARLLSTVSAAGLALTLTLHPGTARTQSLGGDALPETASLPSAGAEDTQAVATPTPLDQVDAARYREIFELQEEGRWHEADAVIDRLTDLRLLGHVLADRYLSDSYRTSYAELASWLQRFGDHPDAPRLYALALKRLPAGWAARSHLRARQPEQVSQWLRIAAEEPRSFYGQLARRALGLDAVFAWEPEKLTAAGAESLLNSRIGQRALALLQIGQERRAAAEFHVLRPQAKPELLRAMLAVAQRYGLPSFAMAAGSVVEEVTGLRNDEALFPIPDWQPHGGFSVDRALLFAIARQESGFNPMAQNPSGATGLMQLIPSTASAVAKRLGLPARNLRDPSLNLALGQEYVRMLFEDPNVRNDLFLMAIAYNAGPGNLAKWRRDIDYQDDPLLFIESIPSRETRQFVERVMAGLWVYQARLEQATPSLDAVAAGAWPTYSAQDASTLASGDVTN